MPEGTTPPHGACPTLAALRYGEGASEPVSDPVSTCTFILVSKFLLYNPTDSPRSASRVFVVFLFPTCFCQDSSDMSSRGSCEEDYAAKHRRELQRDINCGATSGWATEEEITAMRADMNQSVREEVRRMPSRPQEAPGPNNPTFMGPINARRAFSHNMQGAIPPRPDIIHPPSMAEAHRVADEFCEQYHVLRREVEILQEENDRLRCMLHRFLTPTAIVPPSPPKDQE